MKMPDVIFSPIFKQAASCIKAGLLLGALLVVPVFGANVVPSPAATTFQGNLPLVDSYVLTFTTPAVGWPAGTTLSIPLTVTPVSFPGTSNAAAALSYISLSSTALTFGGNNQSRSVLVSCNFPVGIPIDSSYVYRVDTTGWPAGIGAPPAGAVIGSSLSPPPTGPVAATVTINTPANLASFTANSFPYAVALNYTASANGGPAISSEDAVLTGFNPDGSINSSVVVPLTQLTGPTVSGTANLSILSAGTYALQVNASNGPRVSAISRFTVVPNGPPPTASINSPVNGSVFTFYASEGAVSIPMVFSGSSSLINITSLVATLDSLPLGFSPGGINTILATGSTSASFTSVLPSSHSLVVTATDLRGQTGSATSNFTINVFSMNWPVPAAINYGTALSASQLNATVSLTGPGGAALPIPGTITYSPAAGTVLPAGAQTLTATFTPTDLTKYKVVTQTMPLTVNKAPLTVTAANATKVYGAANPSFSATIAGFVNADAPSVVSGVASLTSSATATSPVGSYSITAGLGGLTASNYTFSFVAGTLTVTKAPLTVTADNASRAAGAANPTFTATISGFVNGNTVATSVTGAPAFSTTATITSLAGTYPITPSIGSLASVNYFFATFVPGTLTVTGKANQTITFGPLSSVAVGSSPFALTATASSGLAVSYTSSNPAVATVSGNTVTILTSGTTTITASQAGDANYNAAPSVSQALTVTAIQTCPASIMWLPPISLNKVRQGGSVLPIKFHLQECCGNSSRDPDSNGDDHSNDHNGKGDDNKGDDDGSHDDDGRTNRTDDYSGNNVSCHHDSNGRSTNNQNCRHDSDHDDDDDKGCANLRDKTVVISIYETGSQAPATQYKYGTNSPNPPDYVINGDYTYHLNFPTAKGKHTYHIDVYRFPAGSVIPTLVGSKEFTTK